MNTPYWMVLVNVVTSTMILLGVVIYRFIYPKKQINLFVLLIFISLLPIISIFRAGVYESGDLSFHVSEEMIFYQSLSQGNLFPQWGGDMNATYGYPLFMFFYPLPFYFITIFHFIGFSFINSVKIFLAFAYVFSGIFMYMWLNKIFNKTGAFVGALFYLFAPYHFIDLHFRADIGEVLAFVFVPLSLFAATNLITTQKGKWFMIEAFSIACLILSHPAISFEAIPAILLYCLLLIKNPLKTSKQILIQFLSIISGVLLAAFYWFPLLYNLRYTLPHAESTNNVIFTTLPQLLYSPWRMGLLFQGPYGQLAPILGYAQILVLIISLILLFRNAVTKKYKKVLLVSLLIVFICILMMLSFTKPLWDIIPFIKSFQFSYRLLRIVIFAISIVAAIVVSTIKKNWIIIFLCLFVILSTILNWGNRKMIPQITDQVLYNEIPQEAQDGGLAQAVTIWSEPGHTWTTQVPKGHIEILKGKGSIKEITRKINIHIYNVSAKTPLIVRENTLYFPTWHLSIDGKIKEIKILTATKPWGIISFSIPKGTHTVELIFQDTLQMQIGKFISFLTLVLMLTIIYFNKKFGALFRNKKEKT